MQTTDLFNAAIGVKSSNEAIEIGKNIVSNIDGKCFGAISHLVEK